MRNSTRRHSSHFDPQENNRVTPELAVRVANNDVGASNAKGPPSKKRKLDDSPPWKSATTQTPASFFGEDGRRKSGRTNAVPVELLPPRLQKITPTRVSRLSGRQKHSSSENKSSPLSDTNTAATSNSGRLRMNRKAQAFSSSPGIMSRTKPGVPASSISKPSLTKKSTNMQIQLPISLPTYREPLSTKTTAVKSLSSSRLLKTNITTGTRKSQRTALRAKNAVQEELEQLKVEHAELLADWDAAESSSSELSSLDSDGDRDYSEELFTQGGGIPLGRKLKLKFSVPRPIITHPSHIPPGKEFASFSDFLNHDDLKDSEGAMQGAAEEARIRSQLENAINTGFLTPETCSLNLPERQSEPNRQYAHQDHLIAHAIVFQRLLKREQRDHIELMRKRNAAVMTEVKARRPRTRDEIEEEELIENQKYFKEQMSQLRRKWDEVTKEVEKRRIKRAEEEKRLAGKEHLKQMLEHSTQLLEARRGERQASLASTTDMELDDSLKENKFDEMDTGNGFSADYMSSDFDEDEASADDDEKLTVEQLRAKYGGFSTRLDKPTTNGNESDTETESEIVEPGPIAFMHSPEQRDYGGSISKADMTDMPNGSNADTNDDSRVNELNLTSAVLTDSDESVDMDSVSGSGEDAGDENSEEEDNFAHLAAFYDSFSTAADSMHPREDSDDDFQPHRHSEYVTYESGGLGLACTTSVPVLNALTPLGNNHKPMAGQNIAYGKRSWTFDGRKPVPRAEKRPFSMKMHNSPDVETLASVFQDAKDSGKPPSSPTTSPEATPQPGFTLRTPVPFLLRGSLREYQHYGLDWLAGLYSNNTNGILADEMGLGKTIQTIALLAHLACEKAIWGPHLIVVPTSVMLNWEMEFKKWAPGFKILTYYGTREQRLEKRKGWFDSNLWHVCITSYQLVLQDANTFKRRDWHYLVLDEAHNIKNFRSQRWQTLLNFKTQARLLLTGTPLQNNLVELWSLLYFLMPAGSSSAMPAGFTNLEEFQQWFSHPVDKIMEGGREAFDDEARNTITKLHKVLRPYLLRRLKTEVEKQMPGKYEHIVYCRLSKRQRYLYDDFMSMAQTRETLASGNYLSIINCLMQLRKVCNHPDLFETRQIVTSFAMPRSVVADYEVNELLVRRKLFKEDHLSYSAKDILEFTGLVPAKNNHLTNRDVRQIRLLSATEILERHYESKAARLAPIHKDLSTLEGNTKYVKHQTALANMDTLKTCVRLNRVRTQYQPLIGRDLIEVCTDGVLTEVFNPVSRRPKQIFDWFEHRSKAIQKMIVTIEERAMSMETKIIKFGCVTPIVVATDMPQIALATQGARLVQQARHMYPSDPYHAARMRLSIAFPDKRLLQYDCGKLQRLDALLRQLRTGGHRALIFTQMTKVLDILEQFLSIHGHRYLRLDGATKIEQRQILTDRFNNDPRIPVFILSTRSGGLGINLTGADTVIFYDLDWNPAMDKQCQDRCHRIGQTRDVHIYRFVSEYTIESNILRKSDQKRMLGDVVIQDGEFTTDYFTKLTIQDMLGDEVIRHLEVDTDSVPLAPGKRIDALEAAEDLEDVAAAKVAQREVVDIDVADFAEAGRVTTAAPKTVLTNSLSTTAPKITSKKNMSMLVDKFTNKGLGHDLYGLGYGRVDREPDHVDEFMIRFMEWELRDVPVAIPLKGRDRRKRSKKGRPF